MKKYILIALFLFVVSGVFAEDMSFVTTLSAPLATFNVLETGDSTAYSVVSLNTGGSKPLGCNGNTCASFNYCPSKKTGTLTLKNKGTYTDNNEAAYLHYFVMKPGSTLKGTVPQWQVDTLNVNSGANITVSRIISNTFKLKKSTLLNSENIRTSNLFDASAYGTDAVYLGNSTTAWFSDTGLQEGIANDMEWKSLNQASGCPAGKTCHVLTNK